MVKEPPSRPPPSPVRKPPPAKARLRLTILGGGASTVVWVDGAQADPSSMVTLGTHNVEVRSKGMVPQRFTIEVGKGGAVRRVALAPKEAREPKVVKPNVVPKPVDDGKELLLPGQLKPRP